MGLSLGRQEYKYCTKPMSAAKYPTTTTTVGQKQPNVVLQNFLRLRKLHFLLISYKIFSNYVRHTVIIGSNVLIVVILCKMCTKHRNCKEVCVVETAA